MAYRSAIAARLCHEPEFAQWGLRPPMMGTLRVIDEAGPISQREVCESVGVHPSDMVAIIDQLESNGLLTRVRSASDRRRYDLTLTKEGKSALDRFSAIAREVDAEFYAGLSTSERAQLENLLSKLINAHAANRSMGPAILG